MNLTLFANKTLNKFAPAYVDDLFNALAGMGFTERNEFVKSMVARAPEPMTPPKTRKPIEAWWERKLETGILLSDRREEGWIRMLTVADLTDDYIAHTGRTGISKRGNATAMGRFLKSFMPKIKTPSPTMHVDINAGEVDGARYRPGTVAQVKSRVRHYDLPDLPNARKFWEEAYGKRRW